MARSASPAFLPAFFANIRQKIGSLSLKNFLAAGQPKPWRRLAGAEGFEPPNAGTRNQCLTTWRRPIIYHLQYIDAGGEFNLIPVCIHEQNLYTKSPVTRSPSAIRRRGKWKKPYTSVRLFRRNSRSLLDPCIYDPSI